MPLAIAIATYVKNRWNKEKLLNILLECKNQSFGLLINLHKQFRIEFTDLIKILFSRVYFVAYSDWFLYWKLNSMKFPIVSILYAHMSIPFRGFDRNVNCQTAKWFFTHIRFFHAFIACCIQLGKLAEYFFTLTKF